MRWWKKLILRAVITDQARIVVAIEAQAMAYRTDKKRPSQPVLDSLKYHKARLVALCAEYDELTNSSINKPYEPNFYKEAVGRDGGNGWNYND